MSDEAALLAAILAHPDEDTPRLMYADWLDEHGQPERAEFIRIQCDPTADEAAENRAAELEERNRAKWLAGLPQFPRAVWEFRRGFPEYLDSPGLLFLDHYDAFARVPWLRFLFLHHVANLDVRDFLNRPWKPQWAELELMDDALSAAFVYSGYDSTPIIEAVARCPQVSQLRTLGLFSFDITERGVAALVSSPHIDSLRYLHIDGDRNDPRFASLRERFGDRLVIG
jgi:uncharacterized protein (TIGR02996 family)